MSGWKAWRTLLSQQLVDRGADVGPGHERLADQHRIDAGRLQPRHVGPVRMPLSPTTPPIRRNLAPQPQRVLQVDCEGAQVAVVDADQPGAAASTRGRFAGS